MFKRGFSTIASRKNSKLRALKLLWDPRDVKSRGVPSPLCSSRSKLTWQNPHQQWASWGKGQSHKYLEHVTVFHRTVLTSADSKSSAVGLVGKRTPNHTHRKKTQI